ncbi:hypothetical protein MTO96_015967 [Rhipicephalus appendiculatus]
MADGPARLAGIGLDGPVRPVLNMGAMGLAVLGGSLDSRVGPAMAGHGAWVQRGSLAWIACPTVGWVALDS